MEISLATFGTEQQNRRFTNNCNKAFYEAIAIDDFQGFAHLIGLADGADVRAILPRITMAHTVAELGAGYGRAVRHLLQRGFPGRVYAIERAPHLVEYMVHQFASDKVQVLEQDFKMLQLPEAVDHVLWLWSGIMELDAHEQVPTLKHIRTQIKSGGSLFVEIPERIYFIGHEDTPKQVSYNTSWGSVKAYFPEKYELKENLRAAGFSKVQVFSYPCGNLKRRIFFQAVV